MFDNDLMVGIAFALGVGFLMYFFTREPKNQECRQELNEILKNEENKVKGRFE